MSAWGKFKKNLKKETSKAGKKVVREVENAGKDTKNFVKGGTSGFKDGHAKRRGENPNDNKLKSIKESETVAGEHKNPDEVPNFTTSNTPSLPPLPASALDPSVLGIGDNTKNNLHNPDIDAESDGPEIKADKFAADLIGLVESIKENAPDFLEIYGSAMLTIFQDLKPEITDWMLNNVIIQDIASSIVVDALSNYIQGDHSDITIPNEVVKNFVESVLSGLKESMSSEEFVAAVWSDDASEDSVEQPKVDAQQSFTQNSTDKTSASLSKSEEAVEGTKTDATGDESVDSPVVDPDDTDSEKSDNPGDDFYGGAIIGNNVGPFNPETVIYSSGAQEDIKIEPAVAAQNIIDANSVDPLGTQYSDIKIQNNGNAELDQQALPKLNECENSLAAE